MVACFQPHTYARSVYLLDGFRDCFGARRLFILETYAAREAIADGMTAAQLAAEVHDPEPTYCGPSRSRRRGRRQTSSPATSLTVGAATSTQ